MRTIHIGTVTAVHEVASTIAGAYGQTFGDRAKLALGDDESTINPGSQFAELRFPRCSTVTIHAPRLGWGGSKIDAGITWSSSSSVPSIDAAERTARVVMFASAVAERLNRWVDDGSLRVTETGVEVAS